MVEFQADSERPNCGRREPASPFPLGVYNLGGPLLGQLAARVEMEAIYSGNSDRMTIKISWKP